MYPQSDCFNCYILPHSSGFATVTQGFCKCKNFFFSCNLADGKIGCLFEHICTVFLSFLFFQNALCYYREPWKACEGIYTFLLPASEVLHSIWQSVNWLLRVHLETGGLTPYLAPNGDMLPCVTRSNRTSEKRHLLCWRKNHRLPFFLLDLQTVDKKN